MLLLSLARLHDIHAPDANALPQSVASRTDIVATRPPDKIPGWFKFGRVYEGAIAAADDGAVFVGRLYETFLRNVAPVRDFLTPMRMTSVDASRQFPDGSCDLVLIDASHDYESVRADIAAWWPKIKRGGVLAGDDYCWPGVQRAVEEAFGARAKVLGKDKGRHWRATR